MDPMQLIQVTLYSKLAQDFSGTLITNPWNWLWILPIAFLIKSPILYKIENAILELRWFFRDPDQAVILIHSHKKTYTTGYPVKTSIKPLFSNRFQALIHYLLEQKSDKMSSLIETMKFNFDGYDERDVEYVLLPYKNNKILLENNISLKFYSESTEDESSQNGEKNERSRPPMSSTKQYFFELTVPGSYNMPLLKKFIDDCEKEWLDRKKKDGQHIIYELVKTQQDEDDGNMKLILQQYPFKSNKTFDNIFYEKKQELVDYVTPFCKDADPNSEKYLEYTRAGVTFKSTILLYGEPGCGKSCTIRAILNKTKRQGILVRWSLLKKCSDFRTLFRTTTFNGVEYEPKDLCFIFEDFDANNNRVLKTRSDAELSDVLKLIKSEDTINVSTTTAAAAIQSATAAAITQCKDDDELTLDCVLNMLDGIIELHNSMIIFTTNHLEQIDPAFLRPGRIDFKLELKKMTPASIREMVFYKFDIDPNDSLYDKYFDSIITNIITPAEVQNICFRYTKTDIEKCLEEIVHLHQKRNPIIHAAKF
jgi:hypothetical protein